MDNKAVYKIEDWSTFDSKPKMVVEIEAGSRDEAVSKFSEEHYPGVDPEVVRTGLNITYVSGYNDTTKVQRCTDCGSEFSENEVDGHNCCPSCGSKGVPMRISDDVNIKINWHELRILGIWAENWAKQCDKENPEKEKSMLYTVLCIAERLQRQFPKKAPITLFSEIRGLRKEYNIKSDADDDSLLGL